MAGVSPQRGGSNATMVGMVVSIVVAVILGGVLIWLVTQQEQLRADAVANRTAREKIVRGADEAEAKRLFPNAQSGPNKSLMSGIVQSGKALMGRFTGDQSDSTQTALAKLDAAIAKIAADKKDENAKSLAAANGAVALIEQLYEQYSAERDARIKAERANEKALKGLADAEARNKDLEKKFDDRIAKLSTQVEQLQRAKSEFEQLKGEEVRALASKVEATRNELEDTKVTHAKQRRQVASTLRDQDALLTQQANAIREFRGNVPTNAEPLAIARRPVGNILRILPGDSLCYINLGREDNVNLGMTFAVYSADERIPANGRGKASIEVRSVDARTSECRVVSPPSPDDPILEGDAVNNIILSKNRSQKQRFVVVGNFDTDFDGEPDVRGREQIVAYIQRTGGVVEEEVTAATDYVVLGLPPRGEEVVPPEVEETADEPAEEAAADEEATDTEASDEEPADEESTDEEPTDEGSTDEEPTDEEPTDEEGTDEEPTDEEGTDEGDTTDEGDSSDEEEGDGGNGGFGAADDSVPALQRKPEVDPTVPTLKRRYRNEAERYREARRRAAYFSVPTLTQDQFYNFIGIEGKLSDIRRLQG